MRSSHKGQGSAIDSLYLSPLHYSIARLQYYTELYGQVELKPPILWIKKWPGSSESLLLQKKLNHWRSIFITGHQLTQWENETMNGILMQKYTFVHYFEH